MFGAPGAGGAAGQTGGIGPFLQQLMAQSSGGGMGGGMGGLAPYLQALAGGAGGGFRDVARNTLLSAQQNAQPLIGRQPFEVAEEDRPQIGVEKTQAEALESRLRGELGKTQKELGRLRAAEEARRARERKRDRGGRG